MYEINTIYTLNLHNVICQLYRNYTGVGEKYMNKITGLGRNGRKNSFLAFRQRAKSLK